MDLRLVNRGAAYVLLKEYSDAEADFRAAASLAPGDPDVIYNLANLQLHQGNVQDALQTLSALPPAKRDVRCVLLCWDAATGTVRGYGAAATRSIQGVRDDAKHGNEEKRLPSVKKRFLTPFPCSRNSALPNLALYCMHHCFGRDWWTSGAIGGTTQVR